MIWTTDWKSFRNLRRFNTGCKHVHLIGENVWVDDVRVTDLHVPRDQHVHDARNYREGMRGWCYTCWGKWVLRFAPIILWQYINNLCCWLWTYSNLWMNKCHSWQNYKPGQSIKTVPSWKESKVVVNHSMLLRRSLQTFWNSMN